MLDPIDFSIVRFADCVSEELFVQFARLGEVGEFKKGSTIEHHGDVASHISFVQSGLVRLRLTEADGSRFNLSILGEGTTFGETALFLNAPVQFDAFCETDVVLNRFSIDTVNRTIESQPEILQAFNKVANARVYAMLNYIGTSINSPLEHRVAKFLVLMGRESEDQKTIYCRQADLAHALGISRVSMGKSLKSLENKGLINLGYGKIVVPSIQKLKDSSTSTQVE